MNLFLRLNLKKPVSVAVTLTYKKKIKNQSTIGH